MNKKSQKNVSLSSTYSLPIMIKDLHIQNFWLFEDLQIKGLKLVNLIAGKNNTGKTALLEALRIYAAKGDSSVVNNILNNRGMFVPGRSSSYEAIFHVKTSSEKQQDADFFVINELRINRKEYNISFNNSYSTRLNADKSADFPNDKCVFVPFSNGEAQLQPIWDKIALTELEDEVIIILNETIDNRIIRVDVKENNTKVRLKDAKTPVPIQSLGDGVKRILLIAMALVSAKGQLLLIDEIESGLHHSVQEQLWELIFKYAAEWNIQTFITTHSEDTIRTFSYVAAKQEYDNQALFVRLQKGRSGKIEAIAYDTKRLETALDLPTEIR